MQPDYYHLKIIIEDIQAEIIPKTNTTKPNQNKTKQKEEKEKETNKQG